MHPVVSLRPQLEPKKDGRYKMRLLLQGFKEPPEWDIGTNASPVAKYSSIRSLVFQSGNKEQIVASVDISVAFLQADAYTATDRPRYVSLRAYRGADKHTFQLKGPIYGQRSAPRAFYITLQQWLVGDMGYTQSENDPCVYWLKGTGHRLVVWVDDILTRGSVEATDGFFAALADRFDCKDPEYLTDGSTLTYTGWDVSMSVVGDEQVYQISQEREMRRFLEETGLDSVSVRVAPMPDRDEMVDSTPVDVEEERWCRRVIGELNHFVRSTRWDIAHPVSRVSQHMKQPVLGTVKALQHIGGYLKGTLGLSLKGSRCTERDTVRTYVDSDHHGDHKTSSRSHTGVMIVLNGVPLFWRSNKQPKTSLSPAEAEIYALPEACRDARAVSWVLEEMGSQIKWPLQVFTDSSGSRSFQKGSNYDSKMRGCFDKREKWVKEVQDCGDIECVKIDAQNNVSDMLTKCLKGPEYRRQRDIVLRMDSSNANFGGHL